jgi:hypothetical protein
MVCVSALSVRDAKVLSLIFDDDLWSGNAKEVSTILSEGFDPGSERTLAAWLRHASRTDHLIEQSKGWLVAKG